MPHCSKSNSSPGRAASSSKSPTLRMLNSQITGTARSTCARLQAPRNFHSQEASCRSNRGLM